MMKRRILTIMTTLCMTTAMIPQNVECIDSYAFTSDIAIGGYDNSDAEKTAKDNKISLELLAAEDSASVSPAYELGNVNGDGAINAKDAAEILLAAAKIGTGNASGLTIEQEKAADVDGNSVINAKDAAIILRYAAGVGTGSDRKLTDYIDGTLMKPFLGFSGHYFVVSKGGDYDIYLENDGTFTAIYNVDNPFAYELTVIRSEFKGKFSSPTKIDDHTYSFIIESGASTYRNEKIKEDGIIYECRESDIIVGSEFKIFTKDAPDSSLPLTFIDIRDSSQNGTLCYLINPDYSYLLYDVSNDQPYCSEK